MGSDIAARAAPLEPTSARARRSLIAARAARDGISTMVDALRVSKPPRAPLKQTQSSVPAARKHALIPHAEGRAQLEARIHALEDLVAAKDADLVKLKRQWGRALVKRKQFEKERNSAREHARQARENARIVLNTAAAERKRMLATLADCEVPLPALRDAARKGGEMDRALAEEVLAAVDDIQETVAETREHLQARPLPKVEGEGNGVPGSLTVRVRSYSASVATDEDDGKSVASYASSTAFGEDREMQIEALAELVELLDAKLANGPPHFQASSTVARARKTLKVSKPPVREEMKDIIAERDKLRNQLDAIMAEKESVGGEDAALALAAKAEAELRDANEELDVMRDRLKRLDKFAERGLRSEALVERNASLEGELMNAKKTVARLVQERHALRRTTPNSLFSNGSNASKTPRGRNEEAIKRILDWRQRASSENLENGTTANIAPLPFADLDSEGPGEGTQTLSGGLGRAEPLPDRITAPAFSLDIPMKKRRMVAQDSDSMRTKEEASFSDRSLDVGLNDSISAQSVPVQGFLRRHDSFLSAGDVSASGDEITIRNNRNIFNTKNPIVETGLRSLFGEPSQRFITRQ